MQGAEVALWEAGLRSERKAEDCETSAVIGQKWVGAGPERQPQGIPEGSWREDVAEAEVLAVVDVAWGAWGHDGGWVMTEAGQGAEPESEANEEKVASEGEATPRPG